MTLPTVEHDVRLGPLTTLRVGGPARSYVEAVSDEQLVSAVTAADDRGEPVLLLAGGSNVVIGDVGFPGIVIGVATRGIEIERDGDDVVVTVAAGEIWDRLVARVVADGWAGIESLSGIPGSVGATPIQNVGAYGHQVAEAIASVEAYDRTAHEVVHLTPEQCDFGYRSSRFKTHPGRWLILRVILRLDASLTTTPVGYADLADRLGVQVGESASLSNIRRAVLDVRRSKGMVLDIDDHDTWSVGSFFTNPIVGEQQAANLPPRAPRWPTDSGAVKLSAAWLIEHAGFGKGWPESPGATARLSTKHALAITNRGSASTEDVLDLARAVRDGVRADSGIELVPEPTLIGCEL